MVANHRARRCPIEVWKTTIRIPWKQVSEIVSRCSVTFQRMSCLDFIESPIQRQGDASLTNVHLVEFSSKSSPSPHFVYESDGKSVSPFVHHTRFPNYLPEDFTVDETEGVIPLATGYLSDEMLRYVHALSNKLSHTHNHALVQLDEEEFQLIR